MFSKFSITSTSESILSSPQKMTLKYSGFGDAYDITLDATKPLTDFAHLYVDTDLDLTNFRENKMYRDYVLSKSADRRMLLLEHKLSKVLTNSGSITNVFTSSHNIVNVNFLRKERLYTKLKYSRSPAYDIVSGGSAALLAAFLGFLISEKYGFELVDSGDFYFLFMYLVFIAFSIRPLLTTLNSNDPITSIFSIKPVIAYFLSLFYLLSKKIK